MQDTAAADPVLDRAPSVGAMLLRRVAANPDREAFRFPDESEYWVSLTWAQVKDQVFDLAAGLLAFGLEPEERVAIASTTRMDWILADFAVMCAGGATTTVYPTTHYADVAYILTDSDSRIAILENNDQLDKIVDKPEVMDNFRAIILIDGESDHERVYSWHELRERGRAYLAENPGAVDRVIESIKPESLSTLIYTSGTTGKPKGVRLRHDSWTYEGRAVELLDLINQDDLQYLWLPLSHVFGKCLLAIQLQIGFTSAVDGRIDRIVEGLGEVKPTFMCAAPRVFEKVRAKVMMGNASGVKSVIARWAFSIGTATIPYRLNGKRVPALLAAQYKVADKLVFSKLRERLGGRLRYLVSGSAKLSSQVQQWFYAADLLIFEGYGMTETSAVTFVNHPERVALGTVGPTVAGTECKIADDGEILVKGPGVMEGYHNQPEATKEVFTDGWLHTGDIGELDEQGNLRITDRKKDLMKTSGGKYIAPQKVEGVMVANCPYISQAVSNAEGRKYVSAIFALDPDALREWAEGHEEGKLAKLSYEELTQHPDTREMIQGYVDKGNQRLERWETVKRFAIMERELSQEEGEVTPSLKIRRAQVLKLHANTLDKLYDKDF